MSSPPDTPTVIACSTPGQEHKRLLVFCSGMIRSGSTLQYKIAASLLESRGLGRRWVYCPPKELEAKLCGKQVEAMGGAVKIHTITPTVDSLLRTGRAKALYSFRDLRDVTVSAMRAFRLEWPAFKADRYLEHALATELQLLERPGVLVQKYETVIRDLPTAITQIARHLGITLAAGEMGSSTPGTTSRAWNARRWSNERDNHGRRVEGGTGPADAGRSG